MTPNYASRKGNQTTYIKQTVVGGQDFRVCVAMKEKMINPTHFSLDQHLSNYQGDEDFGVWGLCRVKCLFHIDVQRVNSGLVKKEKNDGWLGSVKVKDSTN